MNKERATDENIEERGVFEFGEKVGLHREIYRGGKITVEEWENQNGDITERVVYERDANGRLLREHWTNNIEPERSGFYEYSYNAKGEITDKLFIPAK